MKVWFCWERTNVGRWSPVCYHGEPPRPLTQSKDDPPARSELHAVSAEFLGLDGTPDFGGLAKEFPPPGGGPGRVAE